MKKSRLFIILMLLLTVAISSCKRDEILYQKSNYYLAIRVDTTPTMSMDGEEPKIYTANFYDTETGRLVYNTFINIGSHPKDMPTGAYININPGEYDLLVYNYDTRTTIVEDEQYLERAYAHTETMSYNKGTPIIKMPDHLYVFNERIKVPYVTEKDNVHIIGTKPETILEQWDIRVTNIKNIENIQKINFFLSGQDRGSYVGPGLTKFREHAILIFSGKLLNVNTTKADEDYVVNGKYTTFGRFDDETRCLLTVQIEGPNGSVYYYQEDISDDIEKGIESGDHEINVEADLEINPEQQGGFNPHAEEWSSEYDKIELS